MSKKKYRIYKADGPNKGAIMNPTAQFLARAQQGMQQPSPEEMAMMEQQAMQQQQGGQEQMMQQLIALVSEALQNGAQPEEVVAKLLQDQIEPELVAKVLVEIGMAPQEVNELVSSTMEQLQGGEGQMSNEEMMAMQQQQMTEDPAMEQSDMEAPMMKKGAYVKRRLKKAQEGMEQGNMTKANTNLAAEDDVNNVSRLLQFSKTNTLKNQYEKEYDQEIMPEARLGREARQERRQIRQDERTDRTEMRQAARTARQANRLANRALRQVSAPFGRVPGFSPYSPSPFMGGSIRLEDVERGLFGRLKNFKMSIDGLGFPARFSEGMFINGLYNPYGMPAGQRRIVNRIQSPGQESFVESGNTGGVYNPNTPTPDPTPDPEPGEEDGVVNPDDVVEGGDETPDPQTKNTEDINEEVPVLKTKPGDNSGSNNMTWSQKYGNSLAAIIGLYIVYRVGKGARATYLKRKATRQADGKVKVSGKEVPATKADIQKLQKLATRKGKSFTGATTKGKGLADKYNSPEAKAVRNHPINRPRDPLGRMQKYVPPKPYDMSALTSPKSAQAARKYMSTYPPPPPKPGFARRMARKIPGIGKRFIAPLLIGNYMYDMYNSNFNEGGVIDGSLYKFTGGGDYDYFDDGGYVGYEDVTDPYMPSMEYEGYVPMANEGMYVDPAKRTYQEYLDWYNSEPVEEGYARAKPLSESEWMAEQGFKTQVNPNSGDPRKDLYNSLSDAQKEMYQAEYERRRKAGYGQRNYGMMGYGRQPYYRRGLFNTLMGINAPAAIQRRQYLTQVAGPTYADGTPVIGGALPEGYRLRTGSAKDGEAGIVYNTNNLRDRIFGRKDAAGNRVRVPRKTISYYFEGPNDTTPSLAGGDNAISNFKINPVSDAQPTPQPAGPAMDPAREGFNADSDGNAIPDYLQYENTEPGRFAKRARAIMNDPNANVASPGFEAFRERVKEKFKDQPGFFDEINENRDIDLDGGYAGSRIERQYKGNLMNRLTRPDGMANADYRFAGYENPNSDAYSVDNPNAPTLQNPMGNQSKSGSAPKAFNNPANPSSSRNAFATGSLENMMNSANQALEQRRMEIANQTMPSMPFVGPEQIPINNTVRSSGDKVIFENEPGYIGSAKTGSNPLESFMYDEGGESRRSNRKFAKEQLPLKNKISRKARRDLRRGLNRDEITRDEYLAGVEEKASKMGPFNKPIYGDFNETMKKEEAAPEYVETPGKLVDVSMDQLAENQKIAEAKAEAESKAKAKAARKAKARKNYKFDFDRTQKNYDKLTAFLHKFDNSRTGNNDFSSFRLTESDMDKLGIGAGRTSDMARKARNNYYDQKKKEWGEENLLIPRKDIILQWANSNRKKIEKDWRSGRIDKHTKKALENRILGRQLDEIQRIEDSYYDTFNTDNDPYTGRPFELERGPDAVYHNYRNTEVYDAVGEKNDFGKGIYYTPPNYKKSKAQKGVDGSDEGGVYTWDENGNKVYVKEYGGYQEGDELYMTADEIAQFMAIGGQIEFL